MALEETGITTRVGIGATGHRGVLAAELGSVSQYRGKTKRWSLGCQWAEGVGALRALTNEIIALFSELRRAAYVLRNCDTGAPRLLAFCNDSWRVGAAAGALRCRRC